MMMMMIIAAHADVEDNDVQDDEVQEDDVEDDDAEEDGDEDDDVEDGEDEDDNAEDEVEEDKVEDDDVEKGGDHDVEGGDVEEDDVKREEDDDVENDEVEEEDRSQDLGPHFVRACAVKMHVNNSEEALHTEIYRKNAGAQLEHPDQAPAFTPTVRIPQCGHTVWGTANSIKVARVSLGRHT